MSERERAAAVDPLPLPEVWAACDAVLDAVDQVVVGKRRPLSLVLAGMLAGGHVLLEDFPGLGKTLAARSLAQTLGLDFRRLQFTPDLLPSDVTGSFVYDQRAGEFAFRAGPLFCGLLLADEINRTPPKTQSALLEAMQERQVTVEGRTFALPAPFHVIATANPIEYEGTYPLPEAQLDRFLLRVGLRLPAARGGGGRAAPAGGPPAGGVRAGSGAPRGRAAAGAAGGRGGDRRGHRRRLLRRPGRRDPDPAAGAGRGVPARSARTDAGRPGARGAAPARLRHAGGRQGGGGRRCWGTG